MEKNGYRIRSRRGLPGTPDFTELEDQIATVEESVSFYEAMIDKVRAKGAGEKLLREDFEEGEYGAERIRQILDDGEYQALRIGEGLSFSVCEHTLIEWLEDAERRRDGLRADHERLLPDIMKYGKDLVTIDGLRKACLTPDGQERIKRACTRSGIDLLAVGEMLGYEKGVSLNAILAGQKPIPMERLKILATWIADVEAGTAAKPVKDSASGKVVELPFNRR